MHLNLCLSLALLLPFARAFAYPMPPPGTENIPQLVSESALVCKGEVLFGPIPQHIESGINRPRMTAVAYVRPDRCFKGMPHSFAIPVLVDGFSTGVDPVFLLLQGEYRLFFLKLQHGKYAVVDESFGALQVSRELGFTPEGADPMYLLELDLKAGLRDADRERVLDSIRMLGNMRHLRSTAELKQLLNSPDLLVRTYVWQALLRLKDYSVLPAVAEFLDTQPAAPEILFMPRDRLFAMEFELADEMNGFRDPSTLTFLEHFAVAGRDYRFRGAALQSLRSISSLHTAATFLRALNDPNPDNGVVAMHALIALANDGSLDLKWVPTWKEFNRAPKYYASRCRWWWHTEGRQKAAARAAAPLSQPD